MDGDTFDTLAKRLIQSRLSQVAVGRLTRRTALRVLSGGALVSLGTTTVVASDRRNNHQPFRCLPSPKSCFLKAKKPGDRRRCQRCCEIFRTVSSKKGVCCTPIGAGCSSDTQCCFGSCSAGVCQTATINIPLFTPCTTEADCGIQVGDVCPNHNNICASIQSQKGPITCGAPGSGGGTVCCRPTCGFCRDDCDCCGDLRCWNGTCGPPPPCHQLGENCTDGEPCCAGAGTCDGAMCCLPDGASCPCPEPGNCQGCCSGTCSADGQCGPPCTPYGQACATADECCLLQDGTRIPCSGGLCRFD